MLDTKQNVYEFIGTEENSYKSFGVPICDGYEWKMFEHIRLSILYKNSKFSTGVDDGNRPFKNIIRPILNVAYRSEGFDVKDIQLFVNDAKNYYKSFLAKKFHNKWARKNDIDTFIDELVESYVDFGGVLVKSVNDVKPEVVPLQRIAFCDQTDILSGAICEKHSYSPDQLLEFAGKWDADKIDEAIVLSRKEKDNSQSSTTKAKTPGKYIEVYELHGMFPETWIDENGNSDKFSKQIHIIVLDKSKKDKKEGITLFKGKEAKSIYKLLLRDKIYGRALGFGGVEELFESQIWTNYNIIQIKEMLDVASLMIVQTADKSFGNKNKITNLSKGEILTHEDNKPLEQVNIQPVNMTLFNDAVDRWEIQARTTGSANEAQLGINPASGTPFALENLITSTGQGLHEFRRGKIATFLGEIYRDWILDYLVREMNKGDEWLDELDLDEMQSISEVIANGEANKKAIQMVLDGKQPTQDEVVAFKDLVKLEWSKGGNKKFIKIVQDEFKNLPVDVEVNIANKQKDLGKMTDKLVNIFRQVIANPQVLQNPAIAKIFNEILENSGLSPVNFSGLEIPEPQPALQQPMPQQNKTQNNNQPMPQPAMATQ